MKINLENYPPDCGKTLCIQRNRIFCFFWALMASIFSVFFTHVFFILLPQVLNGNWAKFFPFILFSIITPISLISTICFIIAFFNSKIGALTLSSEGLSLSSLRKDVIYKWTDIHEFQYTQIGGTITYPAIAIITKKNKTHKLLATNFSIKEQELLQLLVQWHQYHNKINSSL